MQIKIKRLHEKAVIPAYAEEGDAGLDLTATTKRVVDTGEYGYIEYGTGLAMEIPAGHVGLLFPRSSVSDTGQILANAVGVVDSKFRGEVRARFKTIPNSREYEVGDRVVQLIVMPYPTVSFEEVDELSSTERGAGGFGSTGQ